MITERLLCVVIACATLFATAFCVMDDWKREMEKDRIQRGYEFLLSHPDLLKQGKDLGPQVIIPRESAAPAGERI